jgi:hypothetical protein
MKLDFGKYQIVTDDRQFIVQEKKVIKESENTEKIGTEYFDTQGYYTTLESALKSLGKRVILENDDLQTISRELKSLENKIDEFKNIFELGA